MDLNTLCNRIFWEAAVECHHFGSRRAINPYSATNDYRHLLFELTRRHAEAQLPTDSAPKPDQILSALRPLLPSALQDQNALNLLDKLAETAILLRREQAKATDIKASAEARSTAQTALDALLAQRDNLSESLKTLPR